MKHIRTSFFRLLAMLVLLASAPVAWSQNVPAIPVVPVAIVGMHYPVSIYSSLAANVATYAVVGLLVETLRRQLRHVK